MYCSSGTFLLIHRFCHKVPWLANDDYACACSYSHRSLLTLIWSSTSSPTPTLLILTLSAHIQMQTWTWVVHIQVWVCMCGQWQEWLCWQMSTWWVMVLVSSSVAVVDSVSGMWLGLACMDFAISEAILSCQSSAWHCWDLGSDCSMDHGLETMQWWLTNITNDRTFLEGLLNIL